MGFCTKEEYHRFLHQCPIFERLLVEDGILLRKYWFSVSDEEQESGWCPGWRTRSGSGSCPGSTCSPSPAGRTTRGPRTRCSCTPTSRGALVRVESDDKRRARINMIAHLLSTIPYQKVKRPKIELPSRPASQGYIRSPREMQTYVPDHAATVEPQARA
jgi:hypothetical protein